MNGQDQNLGMQYRFFNFHVPYLVPVT